MRGLLVIGIAAVLAAAGLAILPASSRGAAVASMPFERTVTAVVDGQVVPGEYPDSFTDAKTGIETNWVQDGTNMTVGVVSPGLGWVGIGFGPEGTLMDGANILIGYVSGGATVLSDEFGVGFEHHSDIQYGGQDNVLAKAGSEAGGGTTLEFRYPLITDDPRDVPLRPGRTYSMLLAFSDTADDLVTMHTAASFLSMTVAPDPSKVPTRRATLQFGYEGEAADGSNVTLRAQLTGDDGKPLEGGLVDFSLNTSVGIGPLGSVETDASGAADLNYTFLSGGEFAFNARFGGDLEYLPAEANLTIIARNAEDSGTFLTLDLAIRVILVMILAGVSLAYMFSLGQVLRIRRIGLDAERARRMRRRASQPKGATGPAASPIRLR